MAYALPAGTPQSYIDVNNETHRAVVALETSKPHYDRSEVNTSGQRQMLTTFYAGTISTLGDAVDVIEKAILLFDGSHATMSNAGSGKKIYAHKTADTVIGGTASASGAQIESDMVTAWGPVVIAQLTALRGHMLNTGGTWHTAPDAFNVVSIPVAITNKSQLFDGVLLLRAIYLDHIAYTAGGVHAMADTTNVISAAPPDSSDDWDAIKAILTEIATDLPAHAADAAFHAAAQTITLSAPSYPASATTAFARANTYKAKHEAHRVSTTYHESSDGTCALTSADATTVSTMITLAEEIRTDQPVHFEAGPISQAAR